MIPLTEIAALLAINGIDDLDQRETWTRLIAAMDDEYLDWREATRPKEPKHGGLGTARRHH